MAETIKIALTACADYQPEHVRAALEDVIGRVGGLDWVKPGMRVGVKLNLCAARKPEQAATTHPVMAAELTKMLVERGASVVLGDSPGEPFTAMVLNRIYAAAGMAATALIQGYASLQRMEINELMPALRSFWFTFHIGAAALSYSIFLVAACVAGRYVYQHRKGEPEDSIKLLQLEELSFRLTALGYLLLTVVIVIGAVWAEAAWSAYWTWDPKEVWALITWIIYTVYFHQRLSRQRSGLWLSWYVILAVPAFLFTFAGVNKLIPGLHSYG